MYEMLSQLILYHQLEQDSILRTFAEVCDAAENRGAETPAYRRELLDRLNAGVRELLLVATSYGFDKNLWRDYLTFLILTDENSFSLTAEKQEMGEGSVKHFAGKDMEVFCRLFTYDFTEAERVLGTDCFTVISDYKAVPKRAQNFNRNVSRLVREISDRIAGVLEEKGLVAGSGERTEVADEKIRSAAGKLLEIISEFYLTYGVGMFGLNRAFRIQELPAFSGPESMRINHLPVKGPEGAGERIIFTPINNTEEVRLADLVGYEVQKQRLRENTEAFLRGFRANNCLLYGDAGTGKSTSIKALLTEYYDQGLRMIQLYKHQMQSLSAVVGEIKHRNYKFIIYMDDLSFEDFEVEYKYLKAVIEGGLENRPDNVLIYATSNRRHLIKETWNDTADVDLEKHRGDTLQEKLSLVDRFGITIPYMKPGRKEYEEIVRELVKRDGRISLGEEEVMKRAQSWEVAHGGFSGRVARQFVDDLAGRI